MLQDRMTILHQLMGETLARVFIEFKDNTELLLEWLQESSLYSVYNCSDVMMLLKSFEEEKKINDMLVSVSKDGIRNMNGH